MSRSLSYENEATLHTSICRNYLHISHVAATLFHFLDHHPTSLSVWTATGNRTMWSSGKSSLGRSTHSNAVLLTSLSRPAECGSHQPERPPHLNGPILSAPDKAIQISQKHGKFNLIHHQFTRAEYRRRILVSILMNYHNGIILI